MQGSVFADARWRPFAFQPGGVPSVWMGQTPEDAETESTEQPDPTDTGDSPISDFPLVPVAIGVAVLGLAAAIFA